MFNLPGIFGRGKASAPSTTDSLDAFFTEDGPDRETETPTPSGVAWPYLAAIGLVALVGTASAGIYWFKKADAVRAAPLAAVTIESDPLGAEVSSDGVARGVTPLTLSVAPGEHTFEIVHAERRKQVRVVARAEAAVVHHVQFDLPVEPAGPKPTATTASKVAASGTAATSGVVVPSGPAAGWLAISSPIPLTVTEGGQVIGSTASARIMVPAGRRELRFVSEELGFSESRTVQVSAGQTAKLAVSVPRAPISINAVPWAEVWVDGVRIGDTPIGNHMVPLGTHEIVFRHPTLGERRQVATVSRTAPTRVSVDMRKQ